MISMSELPSCEVTGQPSARQLGQQVPQLSGGDVWQQFTLDLRDSSAAVEQRSYPLDRRSRQDGHPILREQADRLRRDHLHPQVPLK
jgi:hypothetical protein